jgi:hypothetical protein
MRWSEVPAGGGRRQRAGGWAAALAGVVPWEGWRWPAGVLTIDPGGELEETVVVQRVMTDRTSPTSRWSVRSGRGRCTGPGGGCEWTSRHGPG